MKQISAKPSLPFVEPPLSSEQESAVVAYEERMGRNLRWALSEGSLFFEGKGAVQESLRKIAAKLQSLGIDYAVAGGLALFNHGYRRFTDDIDVLVTRESLQVIHQALDGLGYLPPFDGSKNLRDTSNGVKIEFLVAGEFPGDGKPKPIAFPNPADVSIEMDGIRYLRLQTLVELKLASGQTNAGRIKDLADVQELIKILRLPLTLKEELNPFVRDKYEELWRGVSESAE